MSNYIPYYLIKILLLVNVFLGGVIFDKYVISNKSNICNDNNITKSLFDNSSFDNITYLSNNNTNFNNSSLLNITSLSNIISKLYNYNNSSLLNITNFNNTDLLNITNFNNTSLFNNTGLLNITNFNNTGLLNNSSLYNNITNFNNTILFNDTNIFNNTNINKTLSDLHTSKKYVILIIGQSNAIGTNMGPILDIGDDDLDSPDPITQTHPQSRLRTVYTGIPEKSNNWDHKIGYDSNLQTSHAVSKSMRARNPIPVLGPPPVLNVTYGGGGPYSVNFGFHFAKRLLKLLKNKDDEIWILNAAHGGSSLQVTNIGTWQPYITDLPEGAVNHYTRAVNFYNKAIEDYDLTPIALLFHQGEGDIGLDSYSYKTTSNADYQKQLYLDDNSLFKSIRRDVNKSGNIPILVGTLLYNLYLSPHIGGSIVYNAHTKVSKHLNNSITVKMSDVLDSEPSRYLQLKLKNGNYQPLHYSAASHRMMGKRYLDAFLDRSIVKDKSLNL